MRATVFHRDYLCWSVWVCESVCECVCECHVIVPIIANWTENVRKNNINLFSFNLSFNYSTKFKGKIIYSNEYNNSSTTITNILIELPTLWPIYFNMDLSRLTTDWIEYKKEEEEETSLQYDCAITRQMILGIGGSPSVRRRRRGIVITRSTSSSSSSLPPKPTCTRERKKKMRRIEPNRWIEP